MQYVAGAFSHALRVKQNACEIFPTPFGVSSKFAEKSVYTLQLLCWGYLIKIDDILCKISSIQSLPCYLGIPYSVLRIPLS